MNPILAPMNLKKHAWLLVLILIIVLATILRLWGIEHESYWLDETISIRQAQQENYGDTLELIRHDVHLPLYITLLHFWVKLFGISEFSGRMLSLLFGVTAVLVCYLLAKELFNRNVALVSSLLFAISPIMIYYSQETRLYSLFVLLSLTSFLFYIKFIQSNRLRDFLFYLLFSTLLIYTHLFAFLVILVQNISAFYVLKNEILKKWILSQVILVVLFLPWVTTLINQLGRGQNIVWIQQLSFGMLFGSVLDLVGNIYVLLIFIGCLIYFFVFDRKTLTQRKVGLLFLWLTIPFILVLTYSFLFSPLYHTRYLLFVVPAVIIIVSLLLTRIAQTNKVLSYTVLCLIVLVSLVTVVEQVYHLEKDDWRSVSAYVADNIEGHEYIFINPFYHHDPFTYYFDSHCFMDEYIHSCNYENHNLLALTWDADCCHDVTPLTATDDKNVLSSYLNETVWLISVREQIHNVSLFDYFNDTMILETSREFGDIKIYKFEKK